MLLGLYTKVQTWFAGLREKAREERGASAVEYGLLVALIAAVIVLIVKALGSKVSNAFSTVNSALP
jgi:pilus assembly protein Flp/PilA